MYLDKCLHVQVIYWQKHGFLHVTWKQEAIFFLLAVSKPLAISKWPTISLLAILIPYRFDIGGQVCSVAFKYNSCNTIKTYIFIRTATIFITNPFYAPQPYANETNQHQEISSKVIIIVIHYNCMSVLTE